MCVPVVGGGLDFTWEYYFLVTYSLGFSMFRPYGARHLKRWVHLFSTLFRIVTACGLLGVFLMNSSTLIEMSLIPLWLECAKCFATLFSRSAMSISRKWCTNLLFSLINVCPTYCMPHLLHVIS